MEKYLPNIVGIGEFQKKAASFLKKMHGKREEAVLVSHNKPQAILMSLSRYAELKELENQKEEEISDVLEIVSRGNQEFAQGQTIKAKSMRDLLK